MCHTGHGGDYGTIQNKARSAVFAEKNFHAWMEDVYEGFLSAEEIREIQRGGEIYLNSEEIQERVVTRKALLAEGAEEEGCDDPTCPCHEAGASIEASVVEEQQ